MFLFWVTRNLYSITRIFFFYAKNISSNFCFRIQVQNKSLLVEEEYGNFFTLVPQFQVSNDLQITRRFILWSLFGFDYSRIYCIGSCEILFCGVFVKYINKKKYYTIWIVMKIRIHKHSRCNFDILGYFYVTTCHSSADSIFTIVGKIPSCKKILQTKIAMFL